MSDEFIDTLTALGFTQITVRKFFGLVKYNTWHYETTIEGSTYTLTVYPHKNKFVVLSGTDNLSLPFKFVYDTEADALEMINDTIGKWGART